MDHETRNDDPLSVKGKNLRVYGDDGVTQIVDIDLMVTNTWTFERAMIRVVTIPAGTYACEYLPDRIVLRRMEEQS